MNRTVYCMIDWQLSLVSHLKEGAQNGRMHEREKAEMKRLVEAAKLDDAVLAVILFGSFARGEPARDVDVCLILNPEKLDVIDVAKKSLEYTTKFDLDIHIYQKLPPYIQIRVLREGKIELVKDEDALYDIAIKTSRLFDDFRPRYLEYLGVVAQHG